MEYNFREIERHWQAQWAAADAYKVSNDTAKPKYYVLDMFPYPSGAGLHVGHPLGYIASDIYSRYKRLKGFNVLHPMGYDSFGLPAEQYAIETGQHPAVTTSRNIKTFREQLDKIGFSFDWSRELRTSDPKYYKWTQWIFLQLFNAYYDQASNKARTITDLIKKFETEGNTGEGFTAREWKGMDVKQQHDVLMRHRLAYSSYGEVNWCEALGTVLANDEVVNGVSERGGHPVVKKKMRQWYLRITAYADRLLQGLENVAFTESLKEQQRNWIGKSQGAEITFNIQSESNEVPHMTVYTTRPDTLFGIDFMVVAPEHSMVRHIVSAAQQAEVDQYLTYVNSRSERERMAEVKQITGCFTGAYAIHPFTKKQIPVWIAEYVLAGYGTGAIMAVPCGDQRDFNFASHFNIPITNIIGHHYNGNEANPTKDAILENSDFLNGMVMKDAIDVAITRLEEMGIGKRHVNYRMRDAGFSRQRYWGEPFPIVWKDGVACPLDENELPLELPHVDQYGPGPEGEGPLANFTEWVNLPDGGTRETSTMPGYAGSSWYFLRYMDPHNDTEFCSRRASDYWGQVDLYVGGTEHAVGHLLYSRMWTKVLYDLGLIGHDEPYKKLLNQGMIQGSSRFVYMVIFEGTSVIRSSDLLISKKYYEELQFLIDNRNNKEAIKRLNDLYPIDRFVLEFDVLNINPNWKIRIVQIHVDIKYVDGVELNITEVKKWNYNFKNAEYVLEDGKYICGVEVEKMSKSKYNTVNPNEIIDKYGADTFRMYEMFLGPVEMSKPWDTKGIEGVHRFLKKLWRLFYDDVKGQVWTMEEPSNPELKILHRTIKKIEGDTETFSFNTAVSAYMVCVNDLGEIGCHKKAVLEQLLILLTPYAPFISEELWRRLGNTGSVLDATYPVFEEKYVVETSKDYPVSINGRVRTSIGISLDASQDEVEKIVLADSLVQKWVGEKPPKKIIYVNGKMINVVV